MHGHTENMHMSTVYLVYTDEIVCMLGAVWGFGAGWSNRF